jgi:hypothetical protein
MSNELNRAKEIDLGNTFNSCHMNFQWHKYDENKDRFVA